MSSDLIPTDINFSKVRRICELVLAKDLAAIKSNRFSDVERQVALELVPLEIALTHFQKFQLDADIKRWDSTEDERTEAFFTDLAAHLFQFMATETLDELLPLFFGPNLESDHSIFIKDQEIRDYLYQAFLNMLVLEGRSIDELKRNYLKENHLHHLMPITHYVWPNEADMWRYRTEYLKLNWQEDDYVSSQEQRRLLEIERKKRLPGGYASSFEPEVNLKNTLKRLWHGAKIVFVCLIVYAVFLALIKAF